MDTLGADTGVGRLATFLEGPVFSSECDGWQCDRVMHTSSCDSMRALRRRRCACDASHERYCGIVSYCVVEWKRGGGRRLYPMVAVGEGHCEEHLLAPNVFETERLQAGFVAQSSDCAFEADLQVEKDFTVAMRMVGGWCRSSSAILCGFGSKFWIKISPCADAKIFLPYVPRGAIVMRRMSIAG